MKKAAIITLYGNSNFGNKLQNYAVQETLKKYNLEVDNIINIPLLNNKNVSIKKHFSRLKFYIKGTFDKIFKGLDYHYCYDLNDTKERQKSFLEFNKYINNTKHFFSFRHIKRFNNYDYYFVGSDQVWNPQFGGLSDLDLLTFTDKNKISLCASIGIDNIPNEFKTKTTIALKEFKAISVREDKAKEIIQDLTNREDIKVLVDPTMFLTIDEWNKVSKKPKKLTFKNYILCYFLGELSNERKNKIESFAKINNYEIINILDEDSDFYSSGPSEFIYLESHAKFIFTDSFHSSVFGILYHIPFIVFNREGKRNNMNSRIVTLLNKFGLEDRLFQDDLDIDDYKKIDYNSVEKILISERKKAMTFLETNIK